VDDALGAVDPRSAGAAVESLRIASDSAITRSSRATWIVRKRRLTTTLVAPVGDAPEAPERDPDPEEHDPEDHQDHPS
jgi:hypothetical protein